MKKRMGFVLACLILIPSLAMAQEWGPRAGDGEFSVSATGNSDNSFDNSTLSGQFNLGYYLTRGWELGLRQDGAWIDRQVGGSTWSASSRLFIDYNFDLGRFRPFIGVNGGYLYGGSDVNNTGIAGGEAGLKFYMIPKSFLLLMGEYDATFDSTNEIDEAFDNGRWVYNIGIGINW